MFNRRLLFNGAGGYNVLLLGYQFTVVDSSPITGTITFELQKGFPLPPTE